jgi:hypothetical protein
MTSKTAPARQAKIAEFLNNGEKNAWKDDRKNKFLDVLDSVWERLLTVPTQPDGYLKGGSRGIDRGHYRVRFEKKLIADFRLAQDADFRTRYIKGYEFPNVPRFRQDTASWDNFIRSWSESVAVEASKKSTRSLLTRAITVVCKKFGVTLAELEPDEIRDWLRDSWGAPVIEAGTRTTVGNIVGTYYELPKEQMDTSAAASATSTKHFAR